MRKDRPILAGTAIAALLFTASPVQAGPTDNNGTGNPLVALADTIDALEARVETLQAEVESIDALNTRLQQLESANAALQARLACVSAASTNTDLVIEGCNLHVRDGSGGTDSTSGLGNLVVGYDEGFGGKSGTHNLVVGSGHRYTSYGGLVAGHENSIEAPYANVLGGTGVAVGTEESWAAGSVADVSGALTVNAEDFSVEARNDVTIDGRADVTIEAGNSATLNSARDLSMNALQLAIDASTSAAIAAGTRLSMGASKVAINASAFGSMTAGGTLELESSGLTHLNGSQVRIANGNRPAARLGDSVVNGLINTGSTTLLIP